MVSIIIPCYNAAGLLSETLDNVLQQAYTNWECLIIDDGSTDNSCEVAESYVKRDVRFSYHHQTNAGPSAARNYGIELCKGEYIQFLDSDDMLEKNKLQKQVEILEEDKNCDIIYGNSAYFYSEEDKSIVKETTEPDWQRKVSGKGEDILSTLLMGNIMVVHSPLVRRTIFDIAGMWDNDIWFNEDWDVWLRCALKNLLFRYDDSPQTKALTRLHPDNRSKDLFKMYLNGLKVCVKMDKLVRKDSDKKIVQQHITFYEVFFEKKIVEYYRTDKDKALAISDTLYSITKFNRYQKYKSAIQKMPSFIFSLYSRIQILILAGKS